MKPTFIFFALLLNFMASASLYAQTGTRPASAPARKPTSTVAKPATVIAKPAATPASTPAPARTGNSVAPAQGRTNRTELPASAQTTAPPRPQTQSKPAVRRSSSRGRSGGGGAAPSVGGGGLAYEKGDNLLNMGVGLSSYYYGNPLGISFEIGVDKDISVGGQFDYNGGNYGDNYYNSSRWRYTATYFGARGSYHFNRILNLNTKKIDLYAGLGLGYHTFRWNDTNYGYGYDFRSGLFFNYFVGGKYYFNDKIGAFLELGYTGLSSSRVGLSVKF